IALATYILGRRLGESVSEIRPHPFDEGYTSEGDEHAGAWAYPCMGDTYRWRPHQQRHRMVPAALGVVGSSPQGTPGGQARCAERTLGCAPRGDHAQVC